MKKYFIFYLSLPFLSCSSSYTVQKQVFNAFKKQVVIQQKNIATICIVEESETKLKALEYYEIAYNERKKSDYFNRKSVASDINFNVWPIDSLEINFLKKELLNQKGEASLKWTKADFDDNPLTIKKLDEIKKIISNGSSSLNIEAFIISKPLISRNKKNGLIFYSSFDYFNGGETKNKVVLLEKINHKWVVITYFYDPRIMN